MSSDTMDSFTSLFGISPEASARAPGRVNLLGEHTDYNEGFVLPAAVQRATSVEVARSRDGAFAMHSASPGFEGRHRFLPGGHAPEGYPRYVYGCVQALGDQGIEVPPLWITIRSDLPIGSGLSSSAALEVALLRAMRELLGFAMDDVELALAAQRAENLYVGVRCGIMDQMASSLADPDHMLFIDTRSLDYERIAFPPGSDFVAIDSGIPRALSDGGYNERRSECEAAAKALGVRSLREVADPGVADRLPPPLDRRARHVISENARVLTAASGVTARDFGRLMSESHRSLRDDFEVSIRALDLLVEALEAHPKVFGARLTGAGFGGACVALIEAGSAPAVHADTLRAFVARGYNGSVLV